MKDLLNWMQSFFSKTRTPIQNQPTQIQEVKPTIDSDKQGEHVSDDFDYTAFNHSPYIPDVYLLEDGPKIRGILN